MPKIPFLVFTIIAILYFSAARIDTMDVDASQYAEMSREMSVSDNWLQVYDRGNNYLDKPPFLFWVSALSMKVFGANNFGFKFPSIVFALWALFAVYRLARLLYDENTARAAALILGCCQAMFLMTNDVRTDTILMSWVITAIWLIKEWEVRKIKNFASQENSSKFKIQNSKFLVAGCACIAFGMMTKGPIALMVPVFCFAGDWILKRDYKKFFCWEYLLGLLVIGVLLIPMSIGLYQQFDLHPEKFVNENYDVSGLQFFYWSQSFGRITGESPWNNNAHFSFLFENMLWAFLPWTLLFVAAFIINIIGLFKQKFKLLPQQEWLTTGGFILTYLALGSSKYQLPHYLFVVFPLAAIMVAKLINDFFEGKYSSLFKIMKPVQTVISFILLIAALLTFTYVFKSWGLLFLWIVCLIFFLPLVFNKKIKGSFLWISPCAIIIANIFMTHHFYPQLLQYQLGSQLGRFIHEKNIPVEKIAAYKPIDALNALPFYAKRVIGLKKELNVQRGDYLITMEEGLKDVQQQNIGYEIINQGSFFKVSQLTPKFLNPATRESVLSDYYFIMVK